MALPVEDTFHELLDECAAAAADVGRLKDLNARYFKSSLPHDWVAAVVWFINTHLTTLGVAPAWRRLPLSLRHQAPREIGGVGGRPTRWVLSARSQQLCMLRWIDLEWLRSLLRPGDMHRVRIAQWTHAFDDNDDLAASAWSRINHARLEPRGHVIDTISPFKVLWGLDVPSEVRVGLTALCDKRTALRRDVAYRRVHEDLAPRVQADAERAVRPLSAADVEARLLTMKAIELAQGRPTLAATIYTWMTGRSMTRQTMHEMQTKLRSQYGIRRRYWMPARAGASADSKPKSTKILALTSSKELVSKMMITDGE